MASEMITPETLDEIERLEKEATKGPWASNMEIGIHSTVEATYAGEPAQVAHGNTRPDGDFIALVRNNAKALIAAARGPLEYAAKRFVDLSRDLGEENETLRTENERLRGLLRDVRSWLYNMDSPEAFADAEGGAHSIMRRITDEIGEEK